MPTPNLPAQDHLAQTIADLQKQVAALQNPYVPDAQSSIYPGYNIPSVGPTTGPPWPSLVVNVGPSGLLLVEISAGIDTIIAGGGEGAFSCDITQPQTGWVSAVTPLVDLYTTASSACAISLRSAELISGVPQGPVTITTSVSISAANIGFDNATITATAVSIGSFIQNNPLPPS
jgi:hypothetical protein